MPVPNGIRSFSLLSSRLISLRQSHRSWLKQGGRRHFDQKLIVPKPMFFCFFGKLWGWKDGECTWFGSNRYFGSIFTWFLRDFFCKFDIGAWKNRKKIKSSKTLFFCFSGMFWDRENGECSWFGSKPCFYSLNTSIFTWFISKSTKLYYFWSKTEEIRH